MAKKKLIHYIDLDGNPATGEYWFQLEQIDIVEMDLAHKDDVAGYLRSITENHDSRELLKVWKELLFRSVAKRKGNYLDKSQAVRDEFQGSGAYNQLFSELIEMDDAGFGWFFSIMPKAVQEKAAAAEKKEYSNDELLDMSDEDFFKAAGTKDAMQMDQRFLQLAMNRRNKKSVSPVV